MNTTSSAMRIVSGEVYSDPKYTTFLMLQDNITITNENYFPIVIDTLNISISISWTGGVNMEVSTSIYLIGLISDIRLDIRYI